MRSHQSQSQFEGYSVGLGINKLKGVRDSHRTKEIGWSFILDGNQELSGLSLSGKDRGNKSKLGIEKTNTEWT
jgi:hypothetical protein